MSSYYETIGAYTRLSAKWLRHRALPEFWHPRTIGLGYLAIAFVTFGHVAAVNYRADKYEYEQCDRHRKANDDASYDRCEQPLALEDALYGAGAGAFWPLYLSWELQS